MDGVSRRGFLAASALSVPLLTAGSALAEPEGGGRGRVRTGADRLADNDFAQLKGRRVGVVTNPTGVLSDGLGHLVDAMVTSGSVNLVGVFGPEHGFRGTAQAGGSEGEYDDPRTGVRVYDAYGATAVKLAEMYRKANVEVVVFDIADVGVRFYTYIWMLYTAMHAAVLTGAAVLVLDRPNPIGGQAHGPQLDPKHASGVGRKPIALRHGMTMGELARLYNDTFLPAETGKRVEQLDVVQVRNWRRETLFAGTGLPWVPPSPNMPTPETALVYPGTCLFEGTLLSEGRGTTRPFETIGLPKIDWKWAEALNALGLRGVVFRENYFVPTFNKHVNVSCGGVQLVITDPRAFDPIRAGVAMIVEAKRLYPGLFGWRPDNFIHKLWGTERLKDMVDRGAGTAEIVGSYAQEQAEFRKHRAQYLLYR
ncbi:DUF1343 domain-containing protein [Crossiella sp. CA-258035]|uniref:exo-beta-N-acetylmuramidase NamZ family protein n=1 Tax=Crossiella sp. CA-258035 TaxID=2981138 RepID=UPI0024BC476F|nr:DUF1343 domain-containing protein [Crossiella sp. CA-258035]WHT23430.1 DUF1343 domain-containing protein [Crossiella sp. CA-258035]